MEHEYFVSYSRLDRKGNTGFGHCAMITRRKVKDVRDIDRFARRIASEGDFEKVVILNFKEM